MSVKSPKSSRSSKKKDEDKKKKKPKVVKKKAPKKNIAKKNRKKIKQAAELIPGLIVEHVTKQAPSIHKQKTPTVTQTYSVEGHLMSETAMYHTQQKKKFLFLGVATLMLLVFGMWTLNAWGAISLKNKNNTSTEQGLYDLAKEDFSDTLTTLRAIQQDQPEQTKNTSEEQATINQIKKTLQEQFTVLAINIASSTKITTSTTETPSSTQPVLEPNL
jgi:hypothetical protein